MRTAPLLLVAALLGYTAATEVICYWGSWSHYRAGAGQVTVDDLDPNKCSIYIYAFAKLNPTTYLMDVFDPWLDISLKGYEKFVAMKQANPALKVLLALGGWNESRDPKYSVMLASPTLRAQFVAAAVPFLQQHGFDGLDLDYEYPTAADKPNFAAWVTELRAAFAPHGLMLTAAVTISVAKIDAGYDVPTISAGLDFINVMAYDMHGSWESKADHHAPLFPRATDNGSGLDLQSVMAAWMTRGAPAAKLAMGVPLYGRSWTVSGADKTPPANANGAGLAGVHTGEAGFLSYHEICEKVNAGWTKVQDPLGRIGPYAYSGDQWVGYDDASMVATKTQWAVSQGFGGVMVWDVGCEDVRGACGLGTWPLMSSIQANIDQTGTTTTAATTTAATTTAATTTAATTTAATTTAATTTAATTTAATTTAATTTAATTTAATTTAATTTPSTTTTTPSTTTTTTTTQAPGGAFTCPSPNGLFADPADCQKYYNCGHGTPYHYTCPAGTLFDPNNLFCNWANQVTCTVTSGGSTATTTTTSTPTTTTAATTTTTPAGGTDFSCPSPTGWFADPVDCHSFYNCHAGTPYHYTCPAGTSWDQSIVNCDWSDPVTGC